MKALIARPIVDVLLAIGKACDRIGNRCVDLADRILLWALRP